MGSVMVDKESASCMPFVQGFGPESRRRSEISRLWGSPQLAHGATYASRTRWTATPGMPFTSEGHALTALSWSKGAFRRRKTPSEFLGFTVSPLLAGKSASLGTKTHFPERNSTSQRCGYSTRTKLRHTQQALDSLPAVGPWKEEQKKKKDKKTNERVQERKNDPNRAHRTC